MLGVARHGCVADVVQPLARRQRGATCEATDLMQADRDVRVLVRGLDLLGDALVEDAVPVVAVEEKGCASINDADHRRALK